MALDKNKDYIDLKGRPYVLFPALLNLATEAGLDGIASELLQIPSKENEHTAVVLATVTFKDEGGKPRIFACLGDASPATITNKSITAYVRMAETRAIGRAFRMALNIGETMAEELGGMDEDAPHPAASRPDPTRPASTPPPNGGDENFCSHAGCGVKLTPNQAKLSMAKFHAPICPTHQKEYTAVGR